MDAIGADDFHMLANVAGMTHIDSPVLVTCAQRAKRPNDAEMMR
jgi:hypothetical protein